MTLLEDYVTDLLLQTSSIVCLGNYNAKLLHNFSDFFQLSQVIDNPTQVSANSSTTIDLAFVTQSLSVIETDVLMTSHIFDHSMIYFILTFLKPSNTEKFVTRSNFDNLDDDFFNYYASHAQWNEIYNCETLDQKVSKLTNIITEICDVVVTCYTFPINTKYPPWINKNVRKLMNKYKNAHITYRKSKSADDWNTYERLENELHNLIEISRYDYFQGLLDISSKEQ